MDPADPEIVKEVLLTYGSLQIAVTYWGGVIAIHSLQQSDLDPEEQKSFAASFGHSRNLLEWMHFCV